VTLLGGWGYNTTGDKYYGPLRVMTPNYIVTTEAHLEHLYVADVYYF